MTEERTVVAGQKEFSVMIDNKSSRQEDRIMSKKLNYESCKHFYKLRDALADYAYEKLDIEAPLYSGKGHKTGGENLYYEETLADVLDELWERPDILDGFISKNSALLSIHDLNILSSWHNCLKGWFTVFEHKGRVLFLKRNRLFEVSGLMEEIKDVLGKQGFPTVIETTLLPFENGIVYHGFIRVMPISMGEGIRDMIDSEINKALKNPQIITSADDFIIVIPEIEEMEAKERAENEMREAALDVEGKSQMQGYHRSVLAGLSESEREEAINAEMQNNMPADVNKHLVEIIKSGTTKGHITRDLRELISSESKELLQRWAMILGVAESGRGKKAELIQALLPELRTNPFLTELTLRAGLDSKQLESYRKLYEAGGVLELPESEIKTLTGVPSAARLICYSFYTKGQSKDGGKFIFVIPEDIMGILDTLEWEEIEEHAASCRAAGNIAEAAADLRGLVKVEDAFDEFNRFYPAALSRDEFDEEVKDAIIEDKIGCVWLEADEGDSYLINYELEELYGRGEDPSEQDEVPAIIRGSLKTLEFIIESQKGKKARPLENDMLSSSALFDWKCSRPAVRALRDYLDEHVPDSQNDYFFADAVIEDLIDYMSFGVMNGRSSFNTWLEILETHGYVPNEGHLNRIISLLMNMYNSIPVWMNNGWAPNELADAVRGRRTFYNEDGSRMKVGRNDPCPCGSGRKYKNCCGRG